MSFGKPMKAPESEHQEKRLTCAASGCAGRGTVDNGRGFLCFVHDAAPDWRAGTDAIQKYNHIIEAIDEVLRHGEIDWVTGKWQILDRFFKDEPELKPTEAERNHRRWYEYRLRNWMVYLAGTGKRPVPREALPPAPKKRFGNVAL